MSTDDEKNIADIYQNMLNEDMVSASVLGDSGFEMGIENNDFYAPGDARNPYGLGITTRNGKLNTKKKRKGEKKKKNGTKSASRARGLNLL
jgi:hypothetical protein